MIIFIHTVLHINVFLPDCSRLHEGEPALHEEDDDGHDEEEEVVHVLGLLVVNVVADAVFIGGDGARTERI